MERFEKKESIVIDHKTCLEWSDVAGQMSWYDAKKYASSLGDGWRLPTIDELETLVDRFRFDPASSFPGMPSKLFWSSSSYAGGSSCAWFVRFNDGYVYYYDKTLPYYVRCVRSGAKVANGLPLLEQRVTS